VQATAWTRKTAQAGDAQVEAQEGREEENANETLLLFDRSSLTAFVLIKPS
jgi:hypothetical protein